MYSPISKTNHPSFELFLAIYNTKTIFDAPEEKPFENFMGKGENLKIK